MFSNQVELGTLNDSCNALSTLTNRLLTVCRLVVRLRMCLVDDTTHQYDGKRRTDCVTQWPYWTDLLPLSLPSVRGLKIGLDETT